MEDNIWHVFPVNDSAEHILETEWKTIEYGTIGPFGSIIHDIKQRLISNCNCCPFIKEEPNGAIIVIHSSFDGREGIEWINEILNL